MLRSVVLLGLVHVAFTLAPPHPTFHEWESVHQMRLRLNITYDYQPRHIPSEYCRHLTEDECQRKDAEVGLARKDGLIKRRLNPSVGRRIRILVLLVRFPEHDISTLPTRDHFHTLFNGNGINSVNPVGSVKEWFRFNSLGRYRVAFDVQDWQDLDESEAFYAEGVSGRVGDRLQDMFAPVLTRIDDSGAIDWYDGYVDDFGYLYHLAVLHSGIAAEYGNRKCMTTSFENRMWSAGTPSCKDCWESRDFIALNGFAIGSVFGQPECRGSGTGTFFITEASMDVITHEMMHGFGLIDLYDQDRDDEVVGIAGVGAFDSMSRASGWTPNGAFCGHLGAYSRIDAAWLEPFEIIENGFYAIQPSELSSQIYKISLGFPEGEYLLLENRQPIKWDGDWTAGGIVISHVDERAPGQSQRGYPGKVGWPTEHYMVAILQADGNYDIEQGRNEGDATDFWVKGMTLGPGTDGTWPNTDSYQFGDQQETGISITILSPSTFIMVFQVEGLPTSGSRLVNNTNRLRNATNNDGNQVIGDPDTAGATLAWVLSMLVGVGLLVGGTSIFL